MTYLKIVRPINLIVIVFTQLSLYFFVIRPNLAYLITDYSKDLFTLILIVLTTIILAGSGYVINDVLDTKADQVNKPNKYFIHAITNKNAINYYWLLLTFGFFTASLLAYLVSEIGYIFIYLVSAFLLYNYSKVFKHKVLLGNMTVALFCGFVPAILFYSYNEQLTALSIQFPDKSKWLGGILFFYILFAFQTNLIREMVKDIEDLNGDKMVNSRTIATIYGVERAAIISAFHCGILMVLILSLFVFIWLILQNNWIILLGVFMILAPTIYLFILILKASEDFEKQASKLLKSLMISGLLYLIIIGL